MRSSNLKIDFCEEQAIINTAAREFCLNNSNTTTLEDGSSTTNERVALSKLLKPQADN